MKINELLKQAVAYCFLIPVFFVLHSYIQYYGLASAGAAFKVFIKIEAVFIVSFFLLNLFLKNYHRSAQVIAFLGALFLFYGVLKDFLTKNLDISFLAKYSVLVPLLILSCIFIVRAILRKKDFKQSNKFQNILLLLFLFTEGIFFLQHDAESLRQRNQMVENNILNSAKTPVVKDPPDIYLLIFDSYPGTTFLKEHLNYDNTGFDSALAAKGFYIAHHPKSNYNRTAFSMASELNLEYLKNIQDGLTPEPQHYNQASLSIKHAAVTDFLEHNNYDVYNLSVFDIANRHPIFRENFLVLPEGQMLLYNSFMERFRHDILWNFSSLTHGNAQSAGQQAALRQKTFSEENIKKRNFNNKLIDSLPKIALNNTAKPKFIYAHFYLPHPPFFYDRFGKPLTLNISAVNQSMEEKASFISYLEYSNAVILKLVNDIFRNSKKEPVIVLQSDHGYRDFTTALVQQTEYFKNYSSFYFPDKNYSSLYDTISNVNTFPIIFNKYFKTNIPLQKDKTVFTAY